MQALYKENGSSLVGGDIFSFHEYLMNTFLPSPSSPWVNNCVGERNQKYFLQFLVYVGMLAVYSVVLVVISWMGETDPDISMADAQAKMLHSVILLLESGLFGLFVVAIMVDQLHAILCKLLNFLILRKSLIQLNAFRRRDCNRATPNARKLSPQPTEAFADGRSLWKSHSSSLLDFSLHRTQQSQIRRSSPQS